MEGKPLGLLEFFEKLGLTALWTFVGLFFNEENGHVELRFSCPRGRSHHCTECELTHDFRDLLRPALEPCPCVPFSGPFLPSRERDRRAACPVRPPQSVPTGRPPRTARAGYLMPPLGGTLI